MRRALLICCIVAFALIGLSCTPEGALDISVTEIPDGVMIENTGTADCIMFVTSPEGEQRFELAVGENVTLMDISQPVDVSAVNL